MIKKNKDSDIRILSLSSGNATTPVCPFLLESDDIVSIKYKEKDIVIFINRLVKKHRIKQCYKNG